MLRHARVASGVVVEIGGTSTNVAAITNGRPAQSYVRVASHATALRSATQGKAEFSMEFARYADVPNNIGEELLHGPRADRTRTVIAGGAASPSLTT